MNFSLVKKITVKDVYEKKLELADGEQRRLVYQLSGIARAYKTGTTGFGEFVKFQGEFACILPNDKGEIKVDGSCKQFRSPYSIFPDPFSGMLRSTMDQLQEINDGKKQAAADAKQPYIPSSTELRFKINLYAVADVKSRANGGTGYKWQVEPLLEFKGTDALDLLIENMEIDKETGEVKEIGKEVKKLPAVAAPKK